MKEYRITAHGVITTDTEGSYSEKVLLAYKNPEFDRSSQLMHHCSKYNTLYNKLVIYKILKKVSNGLYN